MPLYTLLNNTYHRISKFSSGEFRFVLYTIINNYLGLLTYKIDKRNIIIMYYFFHYNVTCLLFFNDNNQIIHKAFLSWQDTVRKINLF